MHIPNIKPIYRYKLIARPNLVEYAVYDAKTDQIVTEYLSREEAEEKVKILTKLAVSEEEKQILEEKKHRREIVLGYS